MISRLTLILCLLMVASCGSNSNTNRGSESANNRANQDNAQANSGQGGLWNMLEKSRRDKARRQAQQGNRQERLEMSQARGRQRIPDDQAAKMEIWWKQFLGMKPEWTQSRHEWRELGANPRRILVENLLIALVRGYESNNGPIYRRARSELFDLAEDSAPYLVGGLISQSSDSVVRARCIEMLGLIGAPALAMLTDAYDDADAKIKAEILRAVSAMGPLGLPDSVPFLSRVAERQGDYLPRIIAIQGLGKTLHASSIPSLIRCLRDRDVSVRKFAAAGIGTFNRPEVIDALISCLADAEQRAMLGNRESEVAQNCVASLRRVTGQKKLRRAREWQAWQGRQ